MTNWDASHPEPWDDRTIAWLAAVDRLAGVCRTHDALTADGIVSDDWLLSALLLHILDPEGDQ